MMVQSDKFYNIPTTNQQAERNRKSKRHIIHSLNTQPGIQEKKEQHLHLPNTDN